VLYFLIVNYQSAELIKGLLTSLDASSQPTSYFVIINNFLPEQKVLETLVTRNIKIIKAGENLGFGRACNLGLSWIYNQHPHALVWLLNPDTFCQPEIIKKAELFFKRYPEISILGTLIYSENGEIWFAGGVFDPKTGKIASANLLALNTQNSYFLCDWVSGCSLIINLSHFTDCPQFDPNYFLYYEDFDFCQRYQQQGHWVAITDQISIIHQVSAVTNRHSRNKLYHSTYSYLLTLQKYTNSTVFYLRLIRLLTYGVILFPIQPMIALGKITGVWFYFKQKISGVKPLTN